MKIIITGSLGNISKPLAIELVQKGHQVTVISSRPERQKEIENIGAKAAIGTVQDVDFLTATFEGADIVYLMGMFEAAGSVFDKDVDFIGAFLKIGNNYKQSIQQAGVKRIIYLSAIGAHLNKGNGVLFIHYNVEHLLKELPDDVSIKIMRAAAFYTNTFRFIETIKKQGVIVSNYGGDKKEPWVSPLDIASAISEEVDQPFDRRAVRYVASEEVSPNEIAKVLGEAIGKPGLKWVVLPDQQLLDGMLSIGINPQIANGLVEMQAIQRSGLLYEDYYSNQPTLGKIKLTGFVKDFVTAYNQ